MDRLLIEAGRDMILEAGLSGLRVRQVSRRAGVNLGMFHYYFKTKNEFIDKVLQETYEEFFSRFNAESSGKDGPHERLKRALVTLARFIRDNRGLILMLVKDVLDGQKQATSFAKKNAPRHVSIIVELVGQCQKEGVLRKMPLPFAMSFFLGAIGAPAIMIGIMEKAKAQRPLGRPLDEVKNLMLSDSAILERVEMVLKVFSV